MNEKQHIRIRGEHVVLARSGRGHVDALFCDGARNDSESIPRARVLELEASPDPVAWVRELQAAEARLVARLRARSSRRVAA